ncbi:hypothetical protein MUN82_06405 [Hymenobacter aerilatus]|uniref:Uncharacterized protein n=1 Tax=Hymenobacter aerilatus TaxID=2932251 RepID=A0A8T9T3P1_9BACT|nr:hypothetical protein [Hymenobacter aerilatus]UOR06726.1 hypothetical protein MUN82_06405 [Hymenobacter aerilatus]
MNLRTWDHSIALYQSEAQALKAALEAYHYRLAAGAEQRPLTLAQALSIKPTTQVLARVSRLVASPWPRPAPGRPARPRKLRLEFDEQLQLCALYAAGQLRASLPGQVLELRDVLGRVHRQAQPLTAYFQL